MLKLVGATDFFITAPFLLEGAIHGLAAVILSLVVIFAGYRVAAARVPQVTFLPPGMILVFAIFGAAVAALGSAVSLRAFMREKDRP